MAPSITVGAVILLWRKAPAKVSVSHAPSGTMPITWCPVEARPREPHHIGADRSLVDQHQPGGIKHALLSHPASAGAGDLRALSFRGLQAFLKVMPCRAKKRRKRALAGSNPPLEALRKRLLQGRSGCSATRANIDALCASNGDTLPPRGFGLALRLLLQRCSHLTAELALMSKRSAASRREAPSIPPLRSPAPAGHLNTTLALPNPQRRINVQRLAHP